MPATDNHGQQLFSHAEIAPKIAEKPSWRIFANLCVRYILTQSLRQASLRKFCMSPKQQKAFLGAALRGFA